jgi:hypothetical protein
VPLGSSLRNKFGLPLNTEILCLLDPLLGTVPVPDDEDDFPNKCFLFFGFWSSLTLWFLSPVFVHNGQGLFGIGLLCLPITSEIHLRLPCHPITLAYASVVEMLQNTKLSFRRLTPQLISSISNSKILTRLSFRHLSYSILITY